MHPIEIFVISIFIIGLAYILYIILKDPRFMLRSFLRFLRPSRGMAKIILLPVWGFIWLIDIIFKFHIYTDEIEEASKPKLISFKEYDKYLIIKNADINEVMGLFRSFKSDLNPLEGDPGLDSLVIKADEVNDDVIIKIEREISFLVFHSIIFYFENSAPINKVYSVKGILINSIDVKDSYFVYDENPRSLKLIGRTFKNKKMYVDVNYEDVKAEIVFLNSNLDSVKWFNFKHFIKESYNLNFQEVHF